MKLKIISKSHHRNGVSGDPFDVFLFGDEEQGVMVGIDFGGSAFAVLQVDKLASGDVAFGSNSWRGDHYAEEVRRLAEAHKAAVADGALFIRHPLRK